MPGWHAATSEFEQDGRLLNIGLIQEQHPDRARLYLQWQGIDWPILVDAFNLLDVNVVPITLLIDENGIIRHRVGRRADASKAVEAFLAEPVPEPATEEPEPLRHVTSFRGLERMQSLIGEYRIKLAALESGEATESSPGRTAFELGVLYRRRYDEAGGAASDFNRAVEHWGRALAADPNQYIWRRRIQQYGPRLEKPYPFYDWVETARTEIEARGETPLPLSVEPGGAEIAAAIRSFDAALPAGEPDPESKTLRDDKYVEIHPVVVPHVVRPGKTARVHVEFRVGGHDAHWNNEAGGMTVWVDAPARWELDRRRIERPNPAQPVSGETRRFEFEIRVPDDASGVVKVPAYALYYVCEGKRGACLYRRQDFEVPVAVAR